MKLGQDILIRPVLTEKMSMLQETQRKFAFIVHPEANKIDIKKAIEKRFNVKVEKVAISNFQGKVKRLGRFVGKRPDFKKAIVTLRQGFTIELFEGK